MPEVSHAQLFILPDPGNRRIRQRKVFLQIFSLEADGGEAPTSIILPHCIQILHIDYCHGLRSCLVDNFLLRTTSLRGLTCKIENCDDIEWIVNVPSGRNTSTDPHCICFGSLQVDRLRNIIGICKGKIAPHTFSGLAELSITKFHEMKKLFPWAILQDLKNLEKLEVVWCDEMEEIIGREEEGSSQRSNPQITSTTSDLPKLELLNLCELFKLKRICEEKLICDSLVKMIFLNCPNLKRLPFYTPTTNGHPRPSLRGMEVGESLWERLEWDQPHVKTLLQPYLGDSDDDDGGDDD